MVIVAMDESSIGKIGRLPWPRSIHAALLEKLNQARVVAFDLIFDAPSHYEEDHTFAEAIKKHERVVLASQFTFERDEKGDLAQVFQAPLNKFLEAGAGQGFANIPYDPDQVVRLITLVDVNTFEMPFPSLGLAVALVAEGVGPAAIKLDPGQLNVGEKKIPVDSLNRAMPNFWGPGGAFKTISYADVLEGKVSESFFKNKIVLVGVTTAAEHDAYPTPYTTTNMVQSGALPTPGVEIHASTVRSFFMESWYRPVIPFYNVAFLFLTGLIASLAVAGRGPWTGLFGALAVVAGSSGMVLALWYAHWRLNLAAPLAMIFLTYGVMTATDFIQVEMARSRTKDMFSRYVSPDVVEELMREPAKLSLGGRKQLLTVMFCDIRNFTAYSEHKAPEEVVSRLNEYLTAMTHVVFRHGGTLDKYMGDGLMAIFGAPVFYPDHAERAIKAALEIQHAVEELNKKWVHANAPSLKVGIGISTGSAVVGNVGSPERMDYTVIGEDVNLASRVQQLTDAYDALIIISERTVQQLSDVKYPLRYLGHAQLKGFSEPIGVYTVLG